MRTDTYIPTLLKMLCPLNYIVVGIFNRRIMFRISWINFLILNEHFSCAAPPRQLTWSMYIYNIAPDVEEWTQGQLFGPYCTIVLIIINKVHQINKSEGFGLITMRKYNQTAIAIQALIYLVYTLHGQLLSVISRLGRNNANVKDLTLQYQKT